jgi:hypothetical protein
MIDKKRLELEVFIREQTLGPGIMRSRFVDRSRQSDPDPEGLGPYRSELINNIPAGIYSTGILFPVDNSKRMEKGPDVQKDEEGPITPPPDMLEEEEDVDPEEEENVDIDSQSLNQMFPNSMGLTVCLDPKVAQEKDLEIIVSGRYYTKVVLKSPSPDIGVLLEQEKQLFEALLDRLPTDHIIRTMIGIGELTSGVHYIFLSGPVASIPEMKKKVYQLKEQWAETLSAGWEKTYRSLDFIKERLFDQLRMAVPPHTEKGKEIAEQLRQLETFENSLAHILDLITLYESTGYGLWRCETFHCPVGGDLSIPTDFKGKKIISYKEENALADIPRRIEYAGKKKWASLAVSLQYSRYDRERGRNDHLFLKVQLVNTSKPYDDEDSNGGKNYFSMASEEVNKRCFFGVGIEVRSRNLLPYRSLGLGKKEAYTEEEVSHYIYRQYKDRGLGHGCSVKWGEKEGIPFVSTEYIPAQETPDVDPTPRHQKEPMLKAGDVYMPRPIFTDDRFLQFKWLSTLSSASKEELLNGLKQFVQAYGEWIRAQQDKAHPEIAGQIRDACQKDQDRMSKNIELLLSDTETLLCFRLMNTAMFMQLWHSVKAKGMAVGQLMGEKGFDGFFEDFYKDRADDRLFSPDQHAAWRPFQLAFILLNLDGIFQRPDDPTWAERNEQVDLVWFPTGGGKTEAYLGLIALTVIRRRRKFGEMGGGTAVMMRYTLRLLTAQQFQRATLLIMALELIRRWETYTLGEEPIYIGLFVGNDSLPNKLDGLKEEFTKVQKAQNEGKLGRSKIPLRRCPWCGHELNPIQFYEGASSDPYSYNRIFLGCSRMDPVCAFTMSYPLPPSMARKDQGPIPVSLCDEEIYQHPPALLFGTVDKFAQLAHKVSNDVKGRHNDSRRLFGVGNWETEKPKRGYLPPDLIIQDELHLMMGPLGSAVALFESAIDQLCTREGNGLRTRPKVISSTATTRNTPLQIMALFDRKVNLFPKPGLDCDDSFFAFYKRTANDEQGTDMSYSSKRRYIGILPTGRTQMWMQLRLAAILFTHRAVFEKESLAASSPFDEKAYSKELVEAIDNYHTVLTYFNSLREVGKTESQIYSYLIKEIRRVFNNVVRPGKAMQCFYTYENGFRNGELTGRLSGEEVVGQMERIGHRWSPIDRSAHVVGDVVRWGTTPPDLVISTNMISVGIDIARFNSMIVNCMPRNIAEYIQASSRVARDKPGLVITVHHPFRSRDLSHYERFIEFHEKMYSYVEPISITPFTRKALERYLPLYIATIVRHQGGFPNRFEANSIDEHERDRLLRQLMRYFERRKDHLQGMKKEEISETIKRLLTDENLAHIDELVNKALDAWLKEHKIANNAGEDLVFNYRATNNKGRPQRQLYVDIDEYQDNISSELWRIPQSLRVVEPEAVIHVKQK